MPTSALGRLLSAPEPILLDGAVGTELFRRGVPTNLPLWSAHALTHDEGLQALRHLHADYARAGARILATNTFRTGRRTLERAGLGSEWRTLNRRAVEAARAAAAEAPRETLVAGALAPLEDCYRPDLAPDESTAFDEHRRQAELLSELGVDLILLETMGTAREAMGSLRAARPCGLEILLSLCPKAPTYLLSGEPLDDLIPALVHEGGESLRGLLLNCAIPAVMEQAYPRLADLAGDLPHGLYPHIGKADEIAGWKLPEGEEGEPRFFASRTAALRTPDTRMIGGCCGTSPAHVAALRDTIQTG
jgi:S-methylmethionine-dependent homocysteine/selenocysteine methylase